jgi:hypothetical protein
VAGPRQFVASHFDCLPTTSNVNTERFARPIALPSCSLKLPARRPRRHTRADCRTKGSRDKSPVTPPAAAPVTVLLRGGAASQGQGYCGNKLHLKSDLNLVSSKNGSVARLGVADRWLIGHTARHHERQSYGNDQRQQPHDRFPHERKSIDDNF